MREDTGAWAWPPRQSTPGRRSSATRGLAGFGIALLAGLVPTAVGVFSFSSAPAFRIAVVLDLAVLGVGSLLLVRGGRWLGPAARLAWIGCLYLVGVGFAVLVGDPRGLGVLCYPVLVSTVLVAPLWARVIGSATAAAELLASWLVLGSVNWNLTLVLLSVTFIVTGIRQLNTTIRRLRAARDEIAELTAARERARFARDLHDALGHSLTTITVKTGLVRRVLEQGTGVERATTELRDIERISRQALDEIRSTVSGYRRPSLAAELAGAREVLRAAGIDAMLPQAVDDVRPDLREPFAYVLREGVTNVVRHSSASRCEVRLGPTWLEIHDDGRHGDPVSRPAERAMGGQPDDGSPVTGSDRGPVPGRDPVVPGATTEGSGTMRNTTGSGLAGLAERMTAVGGRFDAGTSTGGGFRLRAEGADTTARPTEETP